MVQAGLRADTSERLALGCGRGLVPELGFLGLIIGGALSGVLFASMMATWWRAPWSAFNIASLMCVVVFVVPTGFEALTPIHWLQWGLPLLLCAMYLDSPAQRAGAGQSAHSPAAVGSSAAS